METINRAARIALALALLPGLPIAACAQAQSPAPASPNQAVTASDLAKLQESINAMRSFYERRIDALEKKVDTLQKQNTDLGAQVFDLRLILLGYVFRTSF